MFSFIRRIWKILLILLITLVVIPYLVEIGITMIPGNGGDDAWIGFWGSFLGSGIAIGGVYWQVQRSIQNEKELTFRSYRPFCIVTYNTREIFRELLLFGNTEDKDSINNILRNCRHNLPSPLLIISNVSTHRMLAVYINSKYNDETTDSFYVEKIDDGMKIGIVTKSLIEKINKPDLKLKTIELYFTTEQREKIKLVFKIDGEKVLYAREERKIENHNDKFDEKEYSLKNFTESLRTRV